MAEVKAIKLKSGEIVIGKVTSNLDNYEVENPASFVQSEQGFGLGVIIPGAKKVQTITIKKRLTQFTIELDDGMVNAYNREFGSGIVTPSIIIP